MGWELVAETSDGIRTFIDGNFRLSITHIVTVNIQDYCWNTIDGKPTPPIAEKTEYRLWEGAYFKGVFHDREKVQEVVSSLRQRAMEKRGRK